MESFTIFTSSAMVEYIILYYFPQNALKKWLSIVCNCIWGTEIAFKVKKQRQDTAHAQKCF